MHMWWPFLDVWLRWWRCVFSPPFLHRPDSQPPGMIINLIIKHLLPTAPALSLLWNPQDPTAERERERGGELEREGGTQEEPEGGVGERRAIRKGHHHIAGFFYTSEKLLFCMAADSMWSYLIPEQKKQGGRNNPMLGGIHSEGPLTQSDIYKQLIS